MTAPLHILLAKDCFYDERWVWILHSTKNAFCIIWQHLNWISPTILILHSFVQTCFIIPLKFRHPLVKMHEYHYLLVMTKCLLFDLFSTLVTMSKHWNICLSRISRTWNVDLLELILSIENCWELRPYWLAVTCHTKPKASKSFTLLPIKAKIKLWT